MVYKIWLILLSPPQIHLSITNQVDLVIIVGSFFLKVFLTCGIWAIAMIVFGFTSFFVKKVIINIYEWISIVPSIGFMLIMTVICRIGFGGPSPI